MASVNLRPGDTLNIHWTSIQDTPLGMQQVDSSFAFSYEELFSKLKTRTKTSSRRSGSDGARFSRVVALATNALRKGKWSTGAEIDRNVVFTKLLERFQDLENTEYVNITSNAKIALNQLATEESYLNTTQKEDLLTMISSIAYATSQSNIA